MLKSRLVSGLAGMLVGALLALLVALQISVSLRIAIFSSCIDAPFPATRQLSLEDQMLLKRELGRCGQLPYRGADAGTAILRPFEAMRQDLWLSLREQKIGELARSAGAFGAVRLLMSQRARAALSRQVTASVSQGFHKVLPAFGPSDKLMGHAACGFFYSQKGQG